jgi:tRNA-2-methylthio-N6-dimethylallyladenosine synthase
VRLVERARFKNSFVFKYSPRRGTKANELFPDDIAEEVKKQRNNELLAVQATISLQENREFIGREVTVLVEGLSRSTTRREGWDGASQLIARTSCDRIVVFEGQQRLVGQSIQVRVMDASAVTLFGEVITTNRIEAAV